MKRSLSSILQFVLGFILGVIFISGVAAGVAYYYFTRMSATPPEPVFSEGEQSPQPKTVEVDNATTTTATNATTDTETEPQLEATTESELESEPESEPELPPEAYRARVTWPQGLSLRAEPSSNAARIGGVNYNAEVIVLGEADDREWQRIMLPWSKEEGWVKNGNTERVD